MEHVFDYHAFTDSNPRGAYSAVFRVNITDTMLTEPPEEFEMCECKLFDTLPEHEYLSYPTIAQTVYAYYVENFLGKVDFHLHSCNSDGENTVEEICNLASKQGLEVIAITDHNKLTLTNPLRTDTLLVVPGVEFSTTYKMDNDITKEIHIIGLFPDGVDTHAFDEIFKNIDVGKEAYVKAVLADLKGRGINISIDEVRAVTPKGKMPGRHQIGQVLINKGYSTSMEDAFDNHIGNFSPYYIPTTKYIKYAQLETVVKQIKRAHGIPILCHVYGYNFPLEIQIEELIKRFKQCAGDIAAIEVYYERYLNSTEKMEFLKSMAKKYHLLESAGSDRHYQYQNFASNGTMKLYHTMIEAQLKQYNFREYINEGISQVFARDEHSYDHDKEEICNEILSHYFRNDKVPDMSHNELEILGNYLKQKGQYREALTLRGMELVFHLQSMSSYKNQFLIFDLLQIAELLFRKGNHFESREIQKLVMHLLKHDIFPEKDEIIFRKYLEYLLKISEVK